MNNNPQYINLGNLMDFINNGRTLNPSYPRQPKTNNTEKTLKHNKKEFKTPMNSIFNEDALMEALRINATETQELQRQIDLKNREAESLRNKLNEFKNKTKIIRNGNDLAITMTRDNLVKLIESLSSSLTKSNADRITFSINNVI